MGLPDYQYPERFQGIALGSHKTLGEWFVATAPNGRQIVVQQTDIGPNMGLAKLVDFHGKAATDLGYTGKDFPTGAVFKVQKADPTLALIMQRKRMIELRQAGVLKKSRNPEIRNWHNSTWKEQHLKDLQQKYRKEEMKDIHRAVYGDEPTNTEKEAELEEQHHPISKAMEKQRRRHKIENHGTDKDVIHEDKPKGQHDNDPSPSAAPSNGFGGGGATGDLPLAT